MTKREARAGRPTVIYGTLRLHPEQYDWLQKRAAESGATISDVIRLGIDHFRRSLEQGAEREREQEKGDDR